jgi:hypothetical protein
MNCSVSDSPARAGLGDRNCRVAREAVLLGHQPTVAKVSFLAPLLKVASESTAI